MPPRAGDRGCLEREGGPYQQGGPPWLLELLLPVGVGVGFPRSYNFGFPSVGFLDHGSEDDDPLDEFDLSGFG